ncbi:MAG: ABC transporter permease [Acidimicrobiales bacterium]
MAQLHKHIGDTVEFSEGAPRDAPVYIPPTPAVIVGTATLPAVGFSSVVDDHTSMGTGALVSNAIVPTAFNQATNYPDPTLNGPGLVFVRLRGGVPSAAGLANLQHIAAVANRAFAAVPDGGGEGFTVSVVGVQRPAQIVNYRTIGATPALLASALAVGAVVALGLTLTASVRRRRRDLALLKTLGFTQRQLAATIAWQASVAAVIGIVVGLPLGIAVGRWLWTLFAHQVYAVPHPTVPVLWVILVAVGALVFANVVAALPGRNAARTSTATLLRAE